MRFEKFVMLKYQNAKNGLISPTDTFGIIFYTDESKTEDSTGASLD